MSFITETPKFTLEQVLWLEQVFPENIDPTVSTSELYVSLGQRKVIKTIRTIHEQQRDKPK